ncbi:MAG: hypothetical protein KDF59_03790 [Nitrosomonas sp.]|nr:hypothetical protein [Nitrosomonas sp.]
MLNILLFLLGTIGVFGINLANVQIVQADSFRNPLHDSAAIAQGNAFRAQADNPSAVFYNPGGIVGLPPPGQFF